MSGQGTPLILLSVAALSLSGCLGGNYSGIPLAPGAADPELQDLASRAQRGDKHAQLELGIRFEEGRGVAMSKGKARKLYRAAARADDGAIYAYAPAPTSGGTAQVLPLRGGIPEPGLPAARVRLPSAAPVRVGGSAVASQSGAGPSVREHLASTYLDLIKIDARFERCSGQRLSRFSSSSDARTVRECINGDIQFDCDRLKSSVLEVRSLIRNMPTLSILARYELYATVKCAKGVAGQAKTTVQIVRSPISLANWSLHFGREKYGSMIIPEIQLSPASVYISYICSSADLEEDLRRLPVYAMSLGEYYLCSGLSPWRFKLSD